MLWLKGLARKDSLAARVVEILDENFEEEERIGAYALAADVLTHSFFAKIESDNEFEALVSKMSETYRLEVVDVLFVVDTIMDLLDEFGEKEVAVGSMTPAT